MMTSRLKFLMFAVFLGHGAFSGESFSQDPPFNARASEIQRVRSLFLHSENPEAAETVLKDAFGEVVRNFLGQISEATEEQPIVALEVSFERQLVSTALRERVYFEIASRLKDLGTPACLPLLRKLAERKPVVVAYFPGCRRSIPVPVFNYQLEAKRAEFTVLERTFLKKFEKLNAVGQLDWLVDSADVKPESPRLSASLKSIAELPEEPRKHHRRKGFLKKQ